MNDLVELFRISPKIVLDMRYATPNNFTKTILYPSSRSFLLKKTALRLHRVQLNLEKMGLGLKVFDAYRPLSVQKILWKLIPDPRFVADPAVGSKHNRGASVDVTLVDSRGAELEMPTLFDDFTFRAAHHYLGGSAEALKNRKLLKNSMMGEGFLPIDSEWWHYDDPDWAEHPILNFDIP